MTKFPNPGYTEFTYFYGHDPKWSFWQFSQWADIGFIANGVYYNCCEQYMMAGKAMLFGDYITLDKIMKATHPSIQKKLGRQVANFDAAKWNEEAELIVFKGNSAKFFDDNNYKHLEVLLSTQDTFLVEASPYDKIWGIGIGVEDAKKGMPWNGTNWLGGVLTNVRDFYLTEKAILANT